jgi:hypothetical protein
MSLEFTPEHEKNYIVLSTSVAVALPEMKGKDLVSNLVCLCAQCAVEIKFLHGCSVPWASLKKEKHSAPARDGSVSASPTPPGSPEIQASQDTAASSSGETEGESEGNSTHEDEGEDEHDAYCEGDYCGGDRVVHFREQFDRENPLVIDWSDFNILSQSTLSLVSMRHTQLMPSFTSTMIWLPSFLSSTAKSTKVGRHITNAPFLSTIFCNRQPHVRTIMRWRRLSGSRRLCGTMSHKRLRCSKRRKASPLHRHVEFSAAR